MYESIPVTPEQQKWRRIQLFFGILVIPLSIMSGIFVVTAIGVLFVFMSLYRKKLVIDADAITIHYDYRVKVATASKPLREYQMILMDRAMDITKVAFVRNGTKMYAYFNNKDVNGMIELFRAENPNIMVREVKMKSGIFGSR